MPYTRITTYNVCLAYNGSHQSPSETLRSWVQDKLSPCSACRRRRRARHARRPHAVYTLKNKADNGPAPAPCGRAVAVRGVGCPRPLVSGLSRRRGARVETRGGSVPWRFSLITLNIRSSRLRLSLAPGTRPATPRRHPRGPRSSRAQLTAERRVLVLPAREHTEVDSKTKNVQTTDQNASGEYGRSTNTALEPAIDSV
jgi:hypothetical protein